MEPILRKPIKNTYVSKSMNDKTSDLDSKENLISKEPEFIHSYRLSIALAPILLIIFIFGGKPSLLALCFGSFAAYILDLSGSMEATLMSIVVTLAAIWATIIWASRFLLLESFSNFSLVFVLGMGLLYFFFILVSHFRTLRLEFETLFYQIEKILFSTIPLLATSTLTWFICIEFPFVDLPSCFSFIYFIYLSFLCTPLKSSISSFITPYNDANNSYVLNNKSILIVYSVPVVVGPILYTIVHHNILAFNISSFLKILEAANFPLILVLYSAKRHLKYWDIEIRNQVAKIIGYSTSLTALILIYSLLQHPFFDDIKSFSDWITTNTLFLFILLFVVWLNIAITIPERFLSRLFIYFIWIFFYIFLLLFNSSDIYLFYWSFFVSICLIPVVDYMKKDKMDRINLYFNVSSSYILTFYSSIIFWRAFQSLNFNFEWGDFSYPITALCGLQTYTGYAMTFILLLMGFSQTSEATLGYVSGMVNPSSAASDFKTQFMNFIKPMGFTLIVILISFFNAVIEIVLREQDWSDYSINAEMVYPSYLMAITTVVFLLTCYHLIHDGSINYTILWIVAIIQICKLFHLVGFSSSLIFGLIIVIFAYTLPFVDYYSLISSIEQSQSSDTPNININNDYESDYITAALYIALAGFATYFKANDLISTLPFNSSLNNFTDFQIICLSLSLFSIFSAGVIYLYAKYFVYISNILAFLCVIFFMVATGPFVFTIDPSSSSYLVVSLHPDMAKKDNTGIYLLVAAALSITASMGVIPIQRPFPRILFAFFFSYCAAHSVLGIAFPASMGLDSPHSGAFELPWVYSFLFTLLSTSTGLKTLSEFYSKKRAKQSVSIESIFKNYIFLTWCTFPLLAMVWAFVEDSMKEHALGIMWTATAQFGMMALILRIRTIISEFIPHQESSEKPSNTSILIISSCSAVFAFVWGFVASFNSPHIACDLSIPILSLFFLLTSKNMIYLDIATFKLPCLVSTIWWTLSALYATSLKGLNNKYHHFDAFHLITSHESRGLFGESDVSFWVVDSIWIPLLNLCLIFVPLPSISLSIFTNKNTSEDMMFVLSILSALPIIGASIWSIRLLGLLGLLLGTHRCNELGNNIKISNRII